MSILVRDSGFVKDEWEAKGGLFIDLEKFGQDVADKIAENTCLDIPNSVDTESLIALFDNVAMIRIPFPSFADGRGFSLAKQLRMLGFKGRLRAVGHVIADQYGFARTCGFDEVEIDEALAERQPEHQWLARVPKEDFSYQDALYAERELRNA